MITPLGWQVEAYETVLQKEREGVSRQLVSAPTGTGKTKFATLVAGAFNKVLFLVPRMELLEQAYYSFKEEGFDLSVIWDKEHDWSGHITLAMQPTVYQRLDRIPRELFDLIVLDECHFAGAPTFRTTLDYFTSRLRLGMTATPERYDGASLSNIFDEIVYQLSFPQAVTDGYIVPPIGYRVRSTTDLTDVKMIAGEFAQNELASKVNNPARNQMLIDAWLEKGPNRKALIYGVDVQHARDLHATAASRGKKGEVIWDTDPERKAKVRRLRSGEYDYLANCAILTTGYDDPSIQAIIMGRPTHSRVLHTQCVGRGSRRCDEIGKTDFLVIEAADVTHHNLLTIWDFYGLKMSNDSTDQLLDLEAALKQQQTKFELARKNFINLMGATLDLDYYIEQVDLLRPPPEVPLAKDYGLYPWHYDPPTPRQLEVLASAGYDTIGQDWTKGQASNTIDNLPPTERQCLTLLSLGYDIAGHTWTRGQASIVLDDADLSSADWKKVDKFIGERKKARTPLKVLTSDHLPASLTYGRLRHRCGHTVEELIPTDPFRQEQLTQLPCVFCTADAFKVEVPLFRGASAKQIAYGKAVWLKKLNSTNPADTPEGLASINHASWWADSSRKRNFHKAIAEYDHDSCEARSVYVELKPENIY